MSEGQIPHVDHKIEACLDRELSPQEKAEVHAHINQCDRCAALWKESEKVRAAFAADKSDGPLRPVWPAVQDRLIESRLSGRGIAFRLGASVAAAAGLLIGLYMGSIDVTGNGKMTQMEEETWSEFGSLLGMESSGSLDNLFLSPVDEEDEAL